MKKILSLLLVSSFAYGASQKEWVPKYQKKSLNTQKTEKGLSSKSDLKSVSTVSLNSEDFPENKLEALYMKEPKSKGFLKILKQESLKLKQDAVPTLIKVMKSSKYPAENRWIATYMLGRIMGVKSAPFIAEFSKHPNWMLRLASLKVLLHLNQSQYKGIYARLLEDKSLIVRHQALQNIKEMKIKILAPYVWKMLYNKANYVGGKGLRKRSNIIKEAIKVVGELEFKEARKPMLKMISRSKFKDVHSELDYALNLVSDKDSPKGSIEVKKLYWRKEMVKGLTI